MLTKHKNQIRRRRRIRSRASIKGTSERPRLSIFRSNRHIAAQLIDDIVGKTLVSASSHNQKNTKQKKSAFSFIIGETIAKKAKEHGIAKAVFDRGSYKFHGRVRAVCDGARRGGLQI